MSGVKVPGLDALVAKATGMSDQRQPIGLPLAPSSPSLPGIPSVSLSSLAGLKMPSLSSLPKVPGISALMGNAKSGIPAINTVSGTSSALDALRSRPDALLSFLWEAELQVKGLSLSRDYIEEVSVPFPQITSDNGTFRAGIMKFYPVSRAVGQVSIKFYEDIRLTVSNFLNQWRAKIFNRNGTVNMPEGANGYKGTLIVNVKDAKGTVVGTFKLTGLFPLNPDPFALQSASSERVIVGCEFSVDGFEMNPGSGAASGSTSLSGFTPSNFTSGMNLPSFPGMPSLPSGVNPGAINSMMGSLKGDIMGKIGSMGGIGSSPLMSGFSSKSSTPPSLANFQI